MICQALFSREKIKMSPASVVTGPKLKTDSEESHKGDWIHFQGRQLLQNTLLRCFLMNTQLFSHRDQRKTIYMKIALI